MRKKILFVLPGFTFGGTVFSTLNMISFLKSDYDVYVLPMTYQGPVINKYIDAGVSLIPESISLSSLMGKVKNERNILRKTIIIFFKAIKKALSVLGVDFLDYVFRRIAQKEELRNRYDYVVACQEGAATYFVSHFKQTNRISWFRTEYSIYKTEISEEDLEREKKYYSKIDKVVCVSKTTREDFIKYFPSIADNVLAIHNIQNVSNIRDLASQVVLDFPISDFVIVSVGRFNPQKRFSAIPSLAKKIVEKGCDFKWIIIGDGNAFGEGDKLQEEISKNGMTGTVICLGGKLNPYPYILKSSLLVNTSYVEACPRVVIEAKILKTPVICTDFSSAREFVTDGVDGFVDSINNISEHIAQMILDKKLYKKIKSECDSYEIDNKSIYSKLQDLFK